MQVLSFVTNGSADGAFFASSTLGYALLWGSASIGAACDALSCIYATKCLWFSSLITLWPKPFRASRSPLRCRGSFGPLPMVQESSRLWLLRVLWWVLSALTISWSLYSVCCGLVGREERYSDNGSLSWLKFLATADLLADLGFTISSIFCW